MTDEHGVALRHLPEAVPAERMHPLVQLALKAGATPEPDVMRELLTLQRDWEAGEARKAFDRAMIALRSDLPTSIAHDTTVQYPSKGSTVRYTHSSLAGICDEVVPILARHGFAHRWTGTNTNERVSVTCELTHRDGHSISRTMNAPIDLSGSKSGIQGIASTETMLRRYTLTGLLGIATAASEPTGQNSVAQRQAEPTIQTAPEAIRRKALAAWLSRGLTQEQVEERANLPYDSWTHETIERLREQYRTGGQAEPAIVAEENKLRKELGDWLLEMNDGDRDAAAAHLAKIANGATTIKGMRGDELRAAHAIAMADHITWETGKKNDQQTEEL